jgi:CBS domain-containing protein
MLDEAALTAGDIMSHEVVVVHPDTSLLEAVTLLTQHRIGGMPVVENDKIVGMLCEADVIDWHEDFTERQTRWLDMLADGLPLSQQFLDSVREQHRKVGTLMTIGAITVPETMLARDVAHLMHDNGINRVPVLRDGTLVGIVTRADLIRALAQRLAKLL